MKEKIIDFTQKYKVWILGSVILPMVTVGYDYLETTNFYNNITGTSRLNSAIEMLYSSDPGLQNGLFIESATSSQEFTVLSKLVQPRKDSTSELVPTFILRMAIKNAPYVDIPTSLDNTSRYVSDSTTRRLILGTDFSMAILGNCPRIPFELIDFPICQVKSIGNKYELEKLIEERKKSFRFNFNIVMTLLGIAISFSVYRSKDN